MGWFGGKKDDKKVEAAAAPVKAENTSSKGVVASGDLVNAGDLQSALDWAVNLGQDPNQKKSGESSALFELMFRCKRVLWDDGFAKSQSQQVQDFVRSDMYSRYSAAVVKSLDMDGDGKLTPKDFQIMYDKYLTGAIHKNEATIDKCLPFIGQFVFGVGVGLIVGSLCRRFYRSKYLIAGTSVLLYSGIQYLAQENFVNREVLEAAFKSKVTELTDINGDGELDRKDIDMLVENRLRYVTTKLGPGGIAPGTTGYLSLALGFARGIRFI